MLRPGRQDVETVLTNHLHVRALVGASCDRDLAQYVYDSSEGWMDQQVLIGKEMGAAR